MLKPLVLSILIASSVLVAAEESCTTPDGQTSKCTLLADCPKLLDLTWSEKPEDRTFFMNSRCNDNDTTDSITKPCEIKMTETIPDTLTIGSRIIVTGTPSEDYSRIVINIGNGNGEDHNGNISLHYSIRKLEDVIVRNTLTSNVWGNGERGSRRPFPLRDGQPFKIEIVFEATRALCAVDGVQYFSYQYRDPSPLTSNWVQVEGVTDGSLTIKRRPDWFSDYLDDVSEKPVNKVEAYKSVKQTFKTDLKYVAIITCKGTAPDESSWFSISIGGYDIIHVSFKVDMSKQSIVHNTKNNEEWGPDDSSPNIPFPLEANKLFEIQLKLFVTEIQLLVNGQHYWTYADSSFIFNNLNQVFVTGLQDASLTVEISGQDQKTVPDTPKVCCPPVAETVGASADTLFAIPDDDVMNIDDYLNSNPYYWFIRRFYGRHSCTKNH